LGEVWLVSELSIPRHFQWRESDDPPVRLLETPDSGVCRRGQRSRSQGQSLLGCLEYLPCLSRGYQLRRRTTRRDCSTESAAMAVDHVEPSGHETATEMVSGTVERV
jgi:hypothetical protein